MAKLRIEERLAWRKWVTPGPLESKPIHRWLVFPHSFTSELVRSLIEEWGLSEEDHILDPFSGAGTTLLAAKENRIPATGYDLSPLSVLVGRVKLANYSLTRLERAWGILEKRLASLAGNGVPREYPELVQKALPGGLLPAFDLIAKRIERLHCSDSERDFFRLALLSVLPKYSRAEATGGWLKWVDKRTNSRSLPSTFRSRVEAMLEDVRKTKLPRRAMWSIRQADARELPDRQSTYSAVITSPPYPNRHDYTRVFGVELMFGFLDWEQTRRLRYQSFHSHPEARPRRPESNGYVPPRSLTRTLAKVRRKCSDHRVPELLQGYFLDMWLCLREIMRVTRPGARVALVVGNAQYSGEPVEVDKLTAEVGEQAGLRCDRILVARYRGNSAQQMGRYGRNPSRESIVLFLRE